MIFKVKNCFLEGGILVLSVFVLSFLTFLVFSLSGGITVQEVCLGAILAFIIAAVASSIERKSPKRKVLGLGSSWLTRWLGIIYYIFGPFAVGLYKANIDVAKRIITGSINPGIVKFDPRLRTDEGRTFLADSITLTPGTLTVDIDEAGIFYIHWIDVESSSPSEEQICGPFARWARRLFG